MTTDEKYAAFIAAGGAPHPKIRRAVVEVEGQIIPCWAIMHEGRAVAYMGFHRTDVAKTIEDYMAKEAAK